ncbi:MAG: CRISPR-associated endonuclease Cas6 [bacterium]
MYFKTIILKFESNQEIKGKSDQLRGFFASEFKEYPLSHQHIDNKLIYSYPLIQYKIINKVPMIIGINEGIEVLKKIFSEYDYLNIGVKKYKIYQKEIILKKQDFKLTDILFNYTFQSPWLALNKQNYEKYLKLGTWEKRKELLEKILIGNILSISKSLGYTVSDKIKANIGYFKEEHVTLKGTPMLAFSGKFSINFEIPDYWGIGKSVSRGFGTIKKIIN